jgi:hypothetical protein
MRGPGGWAAIASASIRSISRRRSSTSRAGTTGDRVFLFLHTDDFWRDFHAYRAKGIVFVRGPKEEEYGTAAAFKDLYGNLWDLVRPEE